MQQTSTPTPSTARTRSVAMPTRVCSALPVAFSRRGWRSSASKAIVTSYHALSRGRTHDSLRAEPGDKADSAYRDTVLLPSTPFSMRANSRAREPELQQFWREKKVYERARDREGAQSFVLHDGPPYANGDLHIGHALNKILKDVINKYRIVTGARVKFVPGWDCHGLPIELKVLQSMSQEERASISTAELRKRAAAFARETVARQRESFVRYGVWADWDAPYLTLDPEYEAAQIGVFAKMVEGGHIYRGRKPVHWSPSSRTALAEAELEYPDGHVSPSIYVSMPSSRLSDTVPDALRSEANSSGVSFVVWTTTPWTIPANMAIAVNDKLQYAFCRVKQATVKELVGRVVVVAADLAESLQAALDLELEVIGTVNGAALEGSMYRHPMYDRESPVVIGGDYITTDAGTGLVHTAPGHGQEDYQVGQRYGLELLSPVDEAGRFTSEAGELLAGLPVQTDGNKAVIQALSKEGCLVKHEPYQHKYPYDWRTKKPTIFRTTEQWFASVAGIRSLALEAVDQVNFVPASGAVRLASMVDGRSDWCISRQRKWGVPIPVFYDKETGEPLMTERTMKHIQDIFAERGSDAWWELPIEELLPEEVRGQAGRLRKGEDTMDVWFDSGSSWAGVLGSRAGLQAPADLYLEGSDQHRGWFQSSLLTSVAVTGSAPFKTVLTHGFVLDEKGLKMSKSVGNVVDPSQVIEGGKNVKTEPPYGADVLRLWVASVDYTSDVMIGPGIIKQVSEVYRKIRTTVRFLLGSLSDFDPKEDAVEVESLPSVDRYMLRQHASFLEASREAYESFQFFRLYQSLQGWCSTDLSTFYLDVSKDRLYLSARDSFDRRACQTTIWHLTRGLLAVLAPVLPHLAEDAWQSLGDSRGMDQGPTDSVFLAGWPRDLKLEVAKGEEESWLALRELRDAVNKTLEMARKDKFIGSSLEAEVHICIHDSSAAAREMLGSIEKDGPTALRRILIVSEASFVENVPQTVAYMYECETSLGSVTIGVSKAAGSKCERCWVYSTSVGGSEVHPSLCDRCEGVVTSIKGFAEVASLD